MASVAIDRAVADGCLAGIRNGLISEDIMAIRLDDFVAKLPEADQEEALRERTAELVADRLALIRRRLTDACRAGPIPAEMARHILSLRISDYDKARMHDLAVRNQDDALSPAEKEELSAYGEAGDLLAILQSRARRTLGVSPEPGTGSR